MPAAVDADGIASAQPAATATATATAAAASRPDVESRVLRLEAELAGAHSRIACQEETIAYAAATTHHQPIPCIYICLYVSNMPLHSRTRNSTGRSRPHST